MLFADEFVEVLVLDDLLAIEAAHHGVAVAESVEVGAEDGRVEEAVLTENVHRLVLHRGAGENQLVPGLVAQLVHRLALGCIVGLDALALVRDDQVGIVLQQLFKDAIPPRRFVVDDGHLEALEGKCFEIGEGLETLGFCAQQRLDRVPEVGIVCKFFRPDGADGGGGYDQHSLDLAEFVPGPGDGDGCQGLAAAHLKKETEAFTHCFHLLSLENESW